MKPRAFTAGVALVATLCAAASAQAPVDQFQYERPIVTGGAGPRRLPVDVPLLGGGARFEVRTRGETPAAEGGLQDLRLVDESGRAVPYSAASPAPPDHTAPEGGTHPMACACHSHIR